MGRVVSIDTGKAVGLPGVEGVFTFDDVPKRPFATAGHPFSLDPNHLDVADRYLLTDHVRYMGDEIAIVVAADELTANRALSLIDVEYETYQPLVDAGDVLAAEAVEIHKGTANVVKSHSFEAGGRLEDVRAQCEHVLEGHYKTQIMQHCHLENHTAYGYMDDHQRIVIVSSTQIPHIARRIVAEALAMDPGHIRVIKPHIGGGFGNKQDVILEPMVAFLTSRLNGIPVRLRLGREEGMIGTRVRHPLDVKVQVGLDKDGTIRLIDCDILSNTGAYASHGHSIAAAGAAKSHYMYPRAVYGCKARTIYSNIPSGGAMRGYGSPQMTFAIECLMEEAARCIGYGFCGLSA
jgi:xanthine dehydrogenase molybdenum-binding subunit